MLDIRNSIHFTLCLRVFLHGKKIRNKKVKIWNKEVEAPLGPPKGEGFNFGILKKSCHFVHSSFRGKKSRVFAPLRALREIK